MDADCDTAVEGEEEEMRTLKITPKQLCVALLVICGAFIALTTDRTPISDFGNYFYGAKLTHYDFGLNSTYNVKSFNSAVQALSVDGLFLNHCTVTPQSIFLYQPFTFADAEIGKFVFNCISAVLFVLVLFRFLRRYTIEIDWKLCIVFVAALIPIYYNILFGQTYLVITALMMEAVLSSEKAKWFSGFCLAFAIALKISPAILLIWLLSERKFRVIGWTILFWCVITFLTAVSFEGMPQVLISFYTEAMPRMMNGFVSDPYSSSFQGFVVFLRKLMLPDAILNPDALIAGTERIVQLFNSLFFIGISFALVGTWKNAADWKQKILLLLLFVNITSGYTSTYSLLLIVPFVSFGNTTREWIKVMLYAIVLMFPPRIFDGYSPFLEEYKLWIFIALFIMECKPTFSFARIEKPQLLVGMILFAMVIVKFTQRPEEMPLKYYRPDLVSQDYVLYALTADSALTYISYADGGFRQYHIPVIEDWKPGDQAMTKVHGVTIRKIGEDTDNLLVLSDYHRGPGLFHLYTISKSEFKSISGQ